MRMPRSRMIDATRSTWLHLTSRCVRGAWLCGGAAEHRRAWLEERIGFIASRFACEIAAYSIMSNHLHIVARMEPRRAQDLSPQEVAERWLTLYPSDYHRDGSPKPPTPEHVARLAANTGRLAVCRQRLCDVGWFMKAIKEPLARRANREDKCSGTFWQGRFHSTPLLDQAALVACMVYVDLNPVRAAICERPEDSTHTSIRSRCRQLATAGAEVRPEPPEAGSQPHEPGPTLAATEACIAGAGQGEVGISLANYVALVDATGRIVRNGKRGTIPADLAPPLVRLGLDAQRWVDTMAGPGQMRGTGLGHATARSAEASRREAFWVANRCRLFVADKAMALAS